MTVLISLSTFLVLTNPNVVNAADSSVGQSEASVSFFGQEASDSNNGNNNDDSNVDGGYSNPGYSGNGDNGFVESQSTLPQTGEIQVANLSLLGYLLIAFASILLIEKRLERNFNK